MRQARVATSVVFLLTGLVFTTWAARIPAIQEELGLPRVSSGSPSSG